MHESPKGPVRIHLQKGLPVMKLALRAFALSIVVAGLFAASVSPSSTKIIASHQVASDGFPVPLCGPTDPCPPDPPPPPPPGGGIR
jgi:hypothetical protein